MILLLPPFCGVPSRVRKSKNRSYGYQSNWLPELRLLAELFPGPYIHSITSADGGR
jgi:hypothetical protein